jgi:hypothetical protein
MPNRFHNKEYNRIEPHSIEYFKQRVALALSFTPEMSPCGECGYPVIKGYFCNNCGNTEPNKSFNEQEYVKTS